MIVATLLVAVGCGGHVDTVGHSSSESGAHGSGGTSAMNDGSSGAVTSAGGSLVRDAGSYSEQMAACEDLFLVTSSTRCGGAGREPVEAMRELPLVQSDCLQQFAQPGNDVTARELEACASAMDIADCNLVDGPPQECNFRGTLPGGAACSVSTQCKSGFCDMGAVGPGGGSLPFECGHCSDAANVGDDCSQGGCVVGASCVSHDLAPVCARILVGAEGDPCDEITALCANDLYCSGQSRTCVPLGALGDPCGSQWPTGCVAPNYCDGAPGTCRAPGGVGADCSQGQRCGAGLACDRTNDICAAVQWTEPGYPCDSGVHLCRAGQCYQGSFGIPKSMGVCPSIAALGEACDGMMTACDVGAVCYHGTCVGAHSVVCE